MVLALAAALAGCATVSSQKPVFAPAPDKSVLQGVYEMHGDKGAITLSVRRRDAATYEAFLFDPEGAHEQGLAAEFNAVPLGHGDYVLQVGCLASRKDDGKGKWEMAPTVQYWTLAAARPDGDYWLGFNLSDDAATALSAKYRQVHDKDGLKLDGLAPARANAFFADWLAMQFAEGGDTLLPILKKHEGLASQSAHPMTCRDVAKGAG
jgi:hypothetical protein